MLLWRISRLLLHHLLIVRLLHLWLTISWLHWLLHHLGLSSIALSHWLPLHHLWLSTITHWLLLHHLWLTTISSCLIVWILLSIVLFNNNDNLFHDYDFFYDAFFFDVFFFDFTSFFIGLFSTFARDNAPDNGNDNTANTYTNDCTSNSSTAAGATVNWCLLHQNRILRCLVIVSLIVIKVPAVPIVVCHAIEARVVANWVVVIWWQVVHVQGCVRSSTVELTSVRGTGGHIRFRVLLSVSFGCCRGFFLGS